ncbi:MAG: hypothetical protein ACRERS_10525, partial [Methylococcales bacterium]
MTRSKIEDSSPFGGLDRFLKQLNHDGIPIGPEEILRLHHAFSLQPPAERDTLFNLLACTLCKSPQQKRIFADDFDLWFEEADEVLQSPEQQLPGDETGELTRDQSTGNQSGTDPKHPAKPKTRQAEPRARSKAEQFRTQIAETLRPLPWWNYFWIFWVLLAGIGLWVFYSGPDAILPKQPDTPVIKPIDPLPIPLRPD